MSSLMPWRRGEAQRNGDVRMTPVSQMRWDWDRLFDHFLDDVWSPAPGRSLSMPLEISETEEALVVRADVPGIAPDALEISLVGNVLTLSGEKSDEHESEEGTRHYSERSFGAFQRSMKLPSTVDPEKVTAEHANGVVTVTLQKAEAVRPRRIEIKTS